MVPVSGRLERVACTDFFVELSFAVDFVVIGVAALVSVEPGVELLSSSIGVVCTVELDFNFECFCGVFRSERRLRFIELREKDEVLESSPEEEVSESLGARSISSEAPDWAEFS